MNENRKYSIAAKLEQIAFELSESSLAPEKGQLPGLDEIVSDAVEHLLKAMFPYHFGKFRGRYEENEKRTRELLQAYDGLVRAFKLVYGDDDDNEEEVRSKVEALFEKLPDILSVLKTDIQAGYDGDPAATCLDEVIVTYPGFKAIAIFRIAHELYAAKIPLIPRIMTEYAHGLTGIDIHPGATVGSYFFIDHGTGVVIGETTVIGDHVKLYQHVTLGAKSFEVDEDGNPVKGVKRHPNIGNNVVIYAGATILGGDTYIGDGCVVGGNVWLTHSLKPGEVIINGSQNTFKYNPSQKDEI